MAYLYYKTPNTFWNLVGEVLDDKKDILDTLIHYRDQDQRVIIPELSDIVLSNHIEIFCALPVPTSQYLSLHLLPGLDFRINFNAYFQVQEIVKDYDSLKRGGLYKFQVGGVEEHQTYGLWFLPEKVMKSLQKYNWKQHQDQVAKRLDLNAQILEEAGRIIPAPVRLPRTLWRR